MHDVTRKNVISPIRTQKRLKYAKCNKSLFNNGRAYHAKMYLRMKLLLGARGKKLSSSRIYHGQESGRRYKSQPTKNFAIDQTMAVRASTSG